MVARHLHIAVCITSRANARHRMAYRSDNKRMYIVAWHQRSSILMAAYRAAPWQRINGRHQSINNDTIGKPIMALMAAAMA